MKIKEVMKVKVKKRHGMNYQEIDQKAKSCKEDQEVDWVQCHLIGDNMGTTLKVEINEKSMVIIKLVKNLEKNMVTAIKEGIKRVIVTMTKVAMEAEMLASILSKRLFQHSKGNAIPMLT